MSTSTGIGTLQPRAARRSLWPVGALVALIVVTGAIVAISIGQDRDVESSRQAVVSGTLGNTPTELRGGFADAVGSPASGTAGNTPTELRGGVALGVTADVLTRTERYRIELERHRHQLA